MGLFNKKELKRISELENKLVEYKALTVEEIESRIKAKEKEFEEIEKKCDKRLVKMQKEEEIHNSKISQLEGDIDNKRLILKELKNHIDDMNFDIEMQEFGVYKPKYNCLDSATYKDLIKEVRNKQKSMIKDKIALNYFDGWVLENSKAKGRTMNNQNMKMVLRAFNNECDVLISKTKYNNIDKIKTRIEKAANQIDKMNEKNKISITNKYIDLKFQEVDLCYESSLKIQEEKEILRKQREEEREEKKLAKELKEQRLVIEKEKTHYSNYLDELLSKLGNEENQDYINEEIEKTKKQLEEIKKNSEEIDYRESNKRAGYVYVISNIGAFGKDIYKIGMTRRIEPLERIAELSGASVPFKFDVHGMVFSDNAPTLEAELHKAFDKNKVNMVNNRKEFFHVPIEKIENVLNKNYNKHIELKKSVDAKEYSETVNLMQNFHM